MSTNPFSPSDQVSGYFRDSGGDEQDLSVDRQVAEFRHWLEDNQLREGHLFIDASRPGSTTSGRQGFQDMIRHFRSGNATEKGLVVWRSNRFGRNTNDNQFYKADLRRRGYIIHSLTDKIPPDRYGQIIEYLLDWKDQEFLENLSEDVSSGLRHIVETYGAMPGTPPRGFVREPVTVGTRRSGQPHILARWVPDPAMSPLVRRAYQMLLEGASLVNIQTVTGLYGSLNSYVTFFRNPIYKGELHYKDLVIENYCEPVVDPAIWEKARRILDRRAGLRHNFEKEPQFHPRRLASEFLLSGILRCGKCGAPMNGRITGKNLYYRCSRAVRRRDCGAVNIPSASLEVEVISRIKKLLSDPETLIAAQSERIKEYEKDVIEFPARRNELSLRLENLRRQISRLTDAIAAQGHSPALLEKLTALETQEFELKDELEQIDILLRVKPEPFTQKKIQRLSNQFEQILTKGTKDEQREIIAGWLHGLSAERVEKNRILVKMEIFIPGPDPPAKNVVLRVESPWGHRL